MAASDRQPLSLLQHGDDRHDHANIRLACEQCDRDDKDFITPEQLEQCKAEGWADINEVRSFEEATRTCDQRADDPDGFDITGLVHASRHLPGMPGRRLTSADPSATDTQPCLHPARRPAGLFLFSGAWGDESLPPARAHPLACRSTSKNI